MMEQKELNGKVTIMVEISENDLACLKEHSRVIGMPIEEIGSICLLNSLNELNRHALDSLITHLSNKLR